VVGINLRARLLGEAWMSSNNTAAIARATSSANPNPTRSCNQAGASNTERRDEGGPQVKAAKDGTSVLSNKGYNTLIVGAASNNSSFRNPGVKASAHPSAHTLPQSQTKPQWLPVAQSSGSSSVQSGIKDTQLESAVPCKPSAKISDHHDGESKQVPQPQRPPMLSLARMVPIQPSRPLGTVSVAMAVSATGAQVPAKPSTPLVPATPSTGGGVAATPTLAVAPLTSAAAGSFSECATKVRLHTTESTCEEAHDKLEGRTDETPVPRRSTGHTYSILTLFEIRAGHEPGYLARAFLRESTELILSMYVSPDSQPGLLPSSSEVDGLQGFGSTKGILGGSNDVLSQSFHQDLASLEELNAAYQSGAEARFASSTSSVSQDSAAESKQNSDEQQAGPSQSQHLTHQQNRRRRRRKEKRVLRLAARMVSEVRYAQSAWIFSDKLKRGLNERLLSAALGSGSSKKTIARILKAADALATLTKEEASNATTDNAESARARKREREHLESQWRQELAVLSGMEDVFPSWTLNPRLNVSSVKRTQALAVPLEELSPIIAMQKKVDIQQLKPESRIVSNWDELVSAGSSSKLTKPGMRVGVEVTSPATSVDTSDGSMSLKPLTHSHSLSSGLALITSPLEGTTSAPVEGKPSVSNMTSPGSLESHHRSDLSTALSPWFPSSTCPPTDVHLEEKQFNFNPAEVAKYMTLPPLTNLQNSVELVMSNDVSFSEPPPVGCKCERILESQCMKRKAEIELLSKLASALRKECEELKRLKESLQSECSQLHSKEQGRLQEVYLKQANDLTKHEPALHVNLPDDSELEFGMISALSTTHAECGDRPAHRLDTSTGSTTFRSNGKALRLKLNQPMTTTAAESDEREQSETEGDLDDFRVQTPSLFGLFRTEDSPEAQRLIRHHKKTRTITFVPPTFSQESGIDCENDQDGMPERQFCGSITIPANTSVVIPSEDVSACTSPLFSSQLLSSANTLISLPFEWMSSGGGGSASQNATTRARTFGNESSGWWNLW